MIPFKYLGYDVKIEGPISPSTSQVVFTFNNATGQFGLYIKLTKGASETPAVDVILR